MKKASALILFILCTFIVTTGQTIIENPIHGFANNNYIKISSIELNDTATILNFTANYIVVNWIKIDTNSYILPNGTSQKIFMKGTRGLEVGSNDKWIVPESGVLQYSLIYPKLDGSVKSFDFINHSPTWKITDISLQIHNSILPQSLMGNWIEKDNSSKWILGLYDSVAVFNNRLWHYGKSIKQNDGYQITLIGTDHKEITLFLKENNEGLCFLGIGKQKLIECSHNMINITNHKTVSDKEVIPNPFYKMGMATIRGFINGCDNNNSGSQTLVKNVYDGKYLIIKTNQDGTFEMKIPLLHAGVCQFRLPRKNKLAPQFEYVYLEPGKETVCYFDLNKNIIYSNFTKPFETPALFMGENGEINNELYQILKRRKLKNYSAPFQDSLNKFSTTRFQQLLGEAKREDDEYIFTLLSTGAICEKTSIVSHAIAKVNYAFELLMYNTMKEAKFRDENKIKDFKKKDFPTETLGFPYLNPVKAALKDTMCQMSNRFTLLTETIKTLDEAKKPDYSLLGIMNSMLNKGVVFTSSEQQLYRAIIDMKKPESSAIDSFEYYEKQTVAFKNKYETTIDKIAKELQTLTPSQYLQHYFGYPNFINDYYSLNEQIMGIAQNNAAIAASEMKLIRKGMSVPAFADYLELYNNTANKPTLVNAGSVKKDIQTSESENVLESIIAKHVGQVLFIDFWETWCSPCRSGIAEMASLKEELKDSNIVFVCIANESSPKATWDLLTKGIRGEHYRLNQADYLKLHQQYSIKWIPRYMLVNKAGKIVNPDVGHKSNDELRDILLGLLKG